MEVPLLSLKILAYICAYKTREHRVIFQSLSEKFKNRQAVIGVIGLGYVGLPLSLRYIEENFQVIGFDIDESKAKKIAAGQTYIEHIPSAAIAQAVQKGFRATTDFTEISKVDAIIICVPTPLNKYREPDLSYVIDTVDNFVPYMVPGQVVSLESTTYPGTTDEELLPRIEARGFKVGEDTFLVFSPEREDPGRTDFSTKTTPKVVGGHTPACLKIGELLYGGVIDRMVPVSSTKAAEMTKLLENIHRAINIGLVNEMKIICDKMDLDIHEIIDAASTKPFGFVPYKPGPGLGGHCIPIDPFYLTWKSREYGVNTKFIELAGEINSSMPLYVIEKIGSALNDHGKSIKGSKFLVLGIAYKKNVDDMRESPSVAIMELLRDRGAKVDYSDPHVPIFPKMREHKFDLSSVELGEGMLKSYDCVLVATDHDKFNYDLIEEAAQLIVDTRGRYRGKKSNVVKA